MRITNNMMLRSTTKNINGNKVNKNTLNNQMTSQKKIARPSDDPVVAIRALRLRSNLSEVNQYYEKNIPDAEAWLNITETALTNMEKILEDVRTQCEYGANDVLSTEDRNAILTNLEKLRDQLYSEGNADYAGRTVFTGYRTNSKLTFMEDEANTKYEITEKMDYLDIQEYRYYDGQLTLGTAKDMIDEVKGVATNLTLTDPDEHVYDRLRLAYGGIDTVPQISYSYVEDDGAGNLVEQTGTIDVSGTTYDTIEDWEAAGCVVDAGQAVFIKSTGELIMGETLSEDLKSKKVNFSIDYEKTGFNKGEVRPEYYFNCTDVSDANPDNHVKYEKYDADGNVIEQNIDYVIAMSQTLTVNTNASDVFDESMGRDVDEMINAMQASIAAHAKVEEIEEMMKQEAYVDEESQAALQKWLDAAKKEADYTDDNIQKLYNSYIGNFDEYLTGVNLALTTVGSKGDRLELTETRMSNQQVTVKTLISSNEDRELSDIIIDYTAACTAYEASLQAAGMLNQTSLLNYI